MTETSWAHGASLALVAYKEGLPVATLQDCSDGSPEIQRVLDSWESVYWCNVKGTVGVTAAGRNAIEAMHSAERMNVDQAAAEDLCDRFESVDTAFKGIVTQYQLQRFQEPDTALRDVLPLLDVLDAQLQALLEVATTLFPRMLLYRVRWSRNKILCAQGEAGRLASLTQDSLHSLWFELHEDLLRCAGRQRRG